MYMLERLEAADVLCSEMVQGVGAVMEGHCRRTLARALREPSWAGAAS